MSQSDSVCPTCGNDLPEGALSGMCPACAWRLCSLAPEDDGGGPHPDLDDGDVLFEVPGHRVVELIARGGGGIVYRAIQREPRRDVALKILAPQQNNSPEMRARFRGEAEMVAALDHPAILPVYAVGEHDGAPYFTMKLATGGTLASRGEKLRGNWRAIAQLVADIADAVHYAHARGVIHRDLKPGNVLFDDTGRAFVSDFGVAKFIDSDRAMTHDLSLLGTPAYLAPEAIERGARGFTLTSDVYSLGAILYELLSGRPPFMAENLAALLKAVSETSIRSPDELDRSVPRDLAVIAMRCLARDPESRFPSANGLADDLRRWLEGRPIQSRPISSAERLWQWARRNPALAVLSGVLVVSLVAGGLVLAGNNRRLRRAQQAAQNQLHLALVSEARLRQQSGRAGQQAEAVAAIERAARIHVDAEVRSELAAALARPDLRRVRQLPANFTDQSTVLDFSPDLMRYLVPLLDEGFAEMDAQTGKVMRAFKSTHRPSAELFRYSADGARARVSYLDGTHEVWNLDTHELLWTGSNGALALHPSRPLTAWTDGEGALHLLDHTDGQEARFEIDAGRVLALSFGPLGKRLIVVGGAGALLFDVERGLTVWSKPMRLDGTEPAWSDDGKWIALALHDRSAVAVVDAESGEVLRTLAGNNWPLTAMRFLPGTQRMLTLARDRVIRLWQIRSGRELLEMNMPPRALTVSRDGTRIGGGMAGYAVAIYCWLPKTVSREWTGQDLVDSGLASLDLSPDGRWLVSCDLEAIRIWNAETRTETQLFDFADGDFPTARFAPNGKALIYGGRASGLFRKAVTADSSGGADRLVLGPGTPLGPNRDGLLLGFSRDGEKWFIEREKTGHVVVWPRGRWKDERPVADSGHWDRPVFSPDGRWVLTMGYPLVNTRLWSVSDGSLVGKVPLEYHSGAFFSPDGRWLVTGDQAKYQVWQVPELEVVASWPTQPGTSPWNEAAFSPDGTLFACEEESGGVGLHRVSTWERVITLAPLTQGSPDTMTWSPDSRRLLLGFHGPRVFEWSVAELRNVLAARGMDW